MIELKSKHFLHWSSRICGVRTGSWCSGRFVIGGLAADVKFLEGEGQKRYVMDN